MATQAPYDIVIAGGGLAGLSLSIQLARQGHRVAVIEKQEYPFHRVCGEYISMESWKFLEELGFFPANFKVPLIERLQLSGNNGSILEQRLPLGGFGISRYVLDQSLADLARQAGVEIIENTRVNEITFTQGNFRIETSLGLMIARLACGCFGKRSNLDIKWRRAFTQVPKNKLNNYIGVKYHVRLNMPDDCIALHMFPGGYCGIVKVESDKFNVCYLTTAANLQRCEGNIEKMEKEVLLQNPHLASIWKSMEKIEPEPVTISQISFDRKSQSESHVLMIGDAAGMITPLCGNGMSMALHASKIAAAHIPLFLKGTIDLAELEKRYTHDWRRHFGGRLRMGRLLQRALQFPLLANLLISTGRNIPSIARWMIRQTHGIPF